MNLLCVSESLCVYYGRVVYRGLDYAGAELSSLSRGRLTSDAGGSRPRVMALCVVLPCGMCCADT
jgi:hypothetical protein